MPESSSTPLKYQRYRWLILSLLVFLLSACGFFIVYDLSVEKIWWTTVSIYFPCILFFALGLDAWKNHKVNSLKWFASLLGILNLFLLIYGIWLWWQGESLWGPLTLGFALLTLGINWLSFQYYLQLKSWSPNKKRPAWAGLVIFITKLFSQKASNWQSYCNLTSRAIGPFGPLPTSNSTLSPSLMGSRVLLIWVKKLSPVTASIINP